MKIGEIDLNWLGHSGILIKNSKVVYIDPYNVSEGLEKADIILITHGHYDHCSILDLEKLIKEGTKIFCTPDAQSKVMRFNVPIKVEIVEPGQEINLGDIRVIVVPAYNIGKNFHPKSEGWVGYLIKMNDVIIYHSGDCDVIPEMQKLTGHKQQDKIFVALLPIGGRYTMGVEEALEAARIIKPDYVIPIHWGSLVGNEREVEEFKELCAEENIEVIVLDKI